MRRPDFIVVGARRCGTTWLHQCLKEHPGLTLPSATKELFFFDRYWDRGVAWYERYFRDCPADRVCGEVSPSYFNAPLAPTRIRSLLPQVKLVFALRSPLERVVSLHRHLQLSGDIRISLRDALEVHPELVDEGYYAKHLGRFRDVFERDRMFVLIQENVGPDAGLAPLFAFLGVADDFHPPSLDAKINPARVARAPAPALIAARLSRALHRCGWHRAVAFAKATGAGGLFFRRPVLGKTRLPSDVLRRIHEIYDDDTRLLGAMLGCDLEQVWKY